MSAPSNDAKMRINLRPDHPQPIAQRRDGETKVRFRIKPEVELNFPDQAYAQLWLQNALQSLNALPPA